MPQVTPPAPPARAQLPPGLGGEAEGPQSRQSPHRPLVRQRRFSSGGASRPDPLSGRGRTIPGRRSPSIISCGPSPLAAAILLLLPPPSSGNGLNCRLSQSEPTAGDTPRPITSTGAASRGRGSTPAGRTHEQRPEPRGLLGAVVPCGQGGSRRGAGRCCSGGEPVASGATNCFRPRFSLYKFLGGRLSSCGGASHLQPSPPERGA